MCKCKRCGRKLTSKKSIVRGYGEKCYRITQLYEPTYNTKDELSFLKREINMLKRQIKELKYNGFKQDIAIERIKTTSEEAIMTEETKLKRMIHQELRSLFENENWKNSILRPIEPNMEIVAPPTFSI